MQGNDEYFGGQGSRGTRMLLNFNVRISRLFFREHHSFNNFIFILEFLLVQRPHTVMKQSFC